jgi:hypothetical protein
MTYPGIENDKTAVAVNPDMLAVEARRAEREAEYDKYVALDTIPWGLVPAFHAGDRVPIETVERLKWNDLGLVATRDSAEGREVIARTGTGTVEEQEAWAKSSKAKKADDKADENDTAPKKATTQKAGSN